MMKDYIYKILRIPNSTTPVELKALELWEVRWTARNGEFYTTTQPEVELLTCESDARIFYEAIKSAFALLKHTGKGTEVTIRKRST